MFDRLLKVFIIVEQNFNQLLKQRCLYKDHRQSIIRQCRIEINKKEENDKVKKDQARGAWDNFYFIIDIFACSLVI
jgi:hypothetical protein